MSNNMSFAKAYQELKELTTEFEKGDMDLEKAIPKFKRAAELAAFLKLRLKEIETQIEEIDVSIQAQDKQLAIDTPNESQDINF